MILSRPKETIDNYSIALDRVEKAIAAIRATADAVLLVSWDKGKYARHVAKALGGFLQLHN